MPGRPAARASQNSRIPAPRAEMIPMPVMTTRRTLRRGHRPRSREQPLDARRRLANAVDLPGLLVGDVDVELALQLEQDIEAVEGVDLERLEGAARRDLLDGDPLHL